MCTRGRERGGKNRWQETREIRKTGRKGMGLEYIIMNEVSQALKDEHGVFSLSYMDPSFFYVCLCICVCFCVCVCVHVCVFMWQGIYVQPRKLERDRWEEKTEALGEKGRLMTGHL